MIQTTPSLGFSDAINASTSKIFQCKGRSRRSEFWWTQLLVYIVSFVLTPIVGCLLDLLTIPLTIRRLHDSGRSGWWWGIGALLKVGFIVFLCYDIVMAIINEDNLVGYEDQLAMTLILKYGVFSIAIAIYQVVLLILCCLDSEQTENKYGVSPKYVEKENA
jgi:uncharacterized membrane protein YhaH (DUF805 family)